MRVSEVRHHLANPFETWEKSGFAGGVAAVRNRRLADEAIRGADPSLMGARISPADILFVSCLDWALRYDIPLPANLIDYRDRMAVPPAYQAAKEQNDA